MRNLITVLFLIITGYSAQAQYDEKARVVLDAMSQKYRNISAYSADITNSMVNETEGINEKFEGKITIKGDQYKLEMSDQTVINNGNTVWTYLPDVNEVNIDTYDPSDDEISPSSIYDAYKDGYKYLYIGDESCTTGTCAVIDLVPNDKDAQFFKIRLFVDKKSYSLNNWTMFEKTGNKYKYDITNFNPDISIKDSYFTFDKSTHPGVEIIDLR